MQYFDTSLFVFMPIIFFAYGISFFMLGITLAIEPFAHDVRTSQYKNFLSSPVGFLSLFGILHGLFEFWGMFIILYSGPPSHPNIFRLFLMSTSFYFLLRFGASYRHDTMKLRGEYSTAPPQGISRVSRMKKVQWLNTPNVMFFIWIMVSLLILSREGFSGGSLLKAEIFSRYLVGLPGAVLSSFALWTPKRDSPPGSLKYRRTASVGFALYAVVVSVTPKADFYPPLLFNYENVYLVTHIPTQAFRTACAILIALSMLKFFRVSMDFISIRLKAIFHVIVAVLIPTFCVVLLVCYLSANALLDLSYRENQKFASLATEKLLSTFINTEERVKYYVLLSQSIRGLTPEDIFVSLVRENEEIRAIAFLDEDGELLRVGKDASSSLVSYKSSADDARTKNFLEGFTIDVPANNFYISGHDNASVFMTIPLSKGHIKVLLDLERLYAAGSSIGREKGWHVLLVDEKGKLVLPKEKKDFGEKEILAHRISHQGSYGKPIRENGTYYNAIEGTIGHTGWSVIIEIPRSEIVAPVFKVFKALLIGVFLVYVVSLVLAVLFVQRLTRPIDLIAKRVKSIGAGEFGRAVKVTTGDEIQTLSEEVERMALFLEEKKKMDQQIAQTEKIASLGRLVAGVAHEINNPLGIILGYCQILLREIEPHSGHYKDLKTIEKHALASRKIVEDLLRFSRTHKRMSIEVDINSNMRETLSLVEKHFAKENIAIVFEPGPASPRIVGDPDALHQLFLNLAMNAMDAMKDGGTLTVSTRAFDAESGDMVEVSVKDTGCGISENDIDRIFDPFFTTKEVGKGTGLGLSVSYGIVKDHRGRIWAESEEGKGATFHIVFPALRNHEK